MGRARERSDLDVAVEFIAAEYPNMDPGASEIATTIDRKREWQAKIAELIHDVPVQLEIKNVSPTISPDIERDGMLLYSRATTDKRIGEAPRVRLRKG